MTKKVGRPRGRPPMKIIDNGTEGGPHRSEPMDEYYATYSDGPLWPEQFRPRGNNLVSRLQQELKDNE